MKERPILFNAEMVRAILDGRKTQTRRVVKPQPRNVIDIADFHKPRPYGKSGDRLWVRETFRVHDIARDVVTVHYPASLNDGWMSQIEQIPVEKVTKIIRPDAYGRNKPSIHMPRWASRITLEVTNVRVERVQDISAGDCRAEGHPQRPEVSDHQVVHDDAARDWFMDLWRSINEKRGYGWDVNPFVWVVEFKRVDV